MLDLSAAVTVIYGPNGFGKTSVFDAIDFAATGSVGRLGISGTTERFAKAVAHLDGDPEDSVVSLRFGANGGSHVITRRLRTRTQARLDDATTDRKSALMALTGGGRALADRIENLVSLFRATHLFSQDHQELAREFDRDCALPAQVVSHMLAFDDYSNVRRKASDVCEVLGEESARRRGDVRLLATKIEEAEQVVEELSGRGEDVGESGMPVEDLAALRRRLRGAGLRLPKQESDRGFVRACRGAIQVRISQLEARIPRLRGLVGELSTLPSRVESMASLAASRERSEAGLVGTGRQLEKATEALRAQELTSKELYDRRASVVDLVDAIVWARGAHREFRDLTEAERSTASELADEGARTEEFRQRRAESLASLTQCTGQLEAAKERLKAGRALAVALDELARSAGPWREEERRVIALETEVRDYSSQAQAGNAEERVVSAELKRNSADQSAIDREIAAIERDASDLSRLLSRVEWYVESGSCPLCGHDHGSRDELVRHIGQRRVEDRAAKQRGARARLRAARDELERRLEQVVHVAESIRTKIEQLNDDRVNRVARIRRFEREAAGAGISAEVIRAEGVGEAIERRRILALRASEEEERRTVGLHEKLEQTRADVSKLERRIRDMEATVAGSRFRLEAIQKRLAGLRDDRRAARVSLDTDPSSLVALEAHHRQELEKTEAALGEASDAERN